MSVNTKRAERRHAATGPDRTIEPMNEPTTDEISEPTTAAAAAVASHAEYQRRHAAREGS